MNHDLQISLELRSQSPERLVFDLHLLNNSSMKLLIPYPKITGLHFGHKHTMKVAKWYTHCLVSSSWAGITLSPNETRAIELNVRPESVEHSNAPRINDYNRWCVDLAKDEYLAWFKFQVDDDYFCPDSHYRLKHLHREAAKSDSIVWLGEVKTNCISIVHVE